MPAGSSGIIRESDEGVQRGLKSKYPAKQIVQGFGDSNNAANRIGVRSACQ
jgi:hypothetical protein